MLSVDWVTVEGGERVIRGVGGRWPRAEPDAVSDSTKIGDGEKSESTVQSLIVLLSRGCGGGDGLR